MKRILFQIILLSIPSLIIAQSSEATINDRIVSVIDSSDVKNMVLIQTFDVNVPLDSVWNAYTTKKGWESWATPLAEIDFRINGSIKTNYNKEGVIGDDSTITLHIVNYVPRKMLTLQAEITQNFPEFMKEDAEELYNTIVFEEISNSKTRVISYGIGYKHNDKYVSLMKFFIKGNEMSYENLISSST